MWPRTDFPHLNILMFVDGEGQAGQSNGSCLQKVCREQVWSCFFGFVGGESAIVAQRHDVQK